MTPRVLPGASVFSFSQQVLITYGIQDTLCVCAMEPSWGGEILTDGGSLHGRLEPKTGIVTVGGAEMESQLQGRAWCNHRQGHVTCSGACCGWSPVPQGHPRAFPLPWPCL